jgi:hypothetical protein
VKAHEGALRTGTPSPEASRDGTLPGHVQIIFHSGKSGHTSQGLNLGCASKSKKCALMLALKLGKRACRSVPMRGAGLALIACPHTPRSSSLGSSCRFLSRPPSSRSIPCPSVPPQPSQEARNTPIPNPLTAPHVGKNAVSLQVCAESPPTVTDTASQGRHLCEAPVVLFQRHAAGVLHSQRTAPECV